MTRLLELNYFLWSCLSELLYCHYKRMIIILTVIKTFTFCSLYRLIKLQFRETDRCMQKVFYEN